MKLSKKLLCVILGLGVFAGCASGPGNGGGQGESAAKVAAATCVSQADTARQSCDQGCPVAKGTEHFSVQHKIARENIECKDQCAATHGQQKAQCSTTR